MASKALHMVLSAPPEKSESIKVINLAMSVFSHDGNKELDPKNNPILETFHTPSFGDENFDIPLNLPPVSQQCYSQPHGYGNRHPQQNSHQFAPPQQPGPLTNFHFNQPSQNLHSGGGGGGGGENPFGLQSNGGPPQRLKHETEACLDPQFPPQNFEIPDIHVSNSVLYTRENGPHHPHPLPHHQHPAAVIQPQTDTFQKPLPQNVLQTLGGFTPPSVQPQVKGQGAKVASPPGPGSTNTSPSRDSVSEDSSSEDSLPLAQMAMKRGAPESPAPPPPTTSAKKPKTPKKRKKKDPNEPQKPVSAYALFFRDTQAAIKSQNPNASFGEVSKIVASMWDTLDDEHKSGYKKRTETAKKEYLKQLAAYRASLVSQGALEPQESEKPKMGAPYQPIQRSSLPNPAMTSPSMTMSISNMPLSSMPSPLNTINSPLSRMVSSPMMMNAQTTMMPGHQQPMPGMQQQHTMVQMTNIAPRLAAQQMAPSPGMNAMSGGPSPYSMGNQPQMMGSSNNLGMGSPNGSMCTRQGCPNPAIDNPGWDNDYCSNESVVNHCRDAFSEWASSSRESNGPYASVK